MKRYNTKIPRFPDTREQIVGLISLYGEGKIVSHPQFDCHPRHLQSRGRELSGMQPSFFSFFLFLFFFSLGFHYSIYSPEPPITFVNGLSRRQEFIASYLRFSAQCICIPFEMVFPPRVSLTRARPICCFVSRDRKKIKKVKKKEEKGER